MPWRFYLPRHRCDWSLDKNTAVVCCPSKYWHSPVNHGLSLAKLVLWFTRNAARGSLNWSGWLSHQWTFQISKFRRICSFLNATISIVQGECTTTPCWWWSNERYHFPRNKKRKNSEKVHQVSEQKFKKAKSKNTCKKPIKCLAWCGMEAYLSCTVCKDDSRWLRPPPACCE